MEIALRVVQFWSQIKLVIANRTPASRSCDFVITRLISDQIAFHSVQLPLLNQSRCRILVFASRRANKGAKLKIGFMLVLMLMSALMSHASVDFFVLSFVSACACVASEDQAYESSLVFTSDISISTR